MTGFLEWIETNGQPRNVGHILWQSNPARKVIEPRKEGMSPGEIMSQIGRFSMPYQQHLEFGEFFGGSHMIHIPLIHLPSGNQTWLAGKSPN